MDSLQKPLSTCHSSSNPPKIFKSFRHHSPLCVNRLSATANWFHQFPLSTMWMGRPVRTGIDKYLPKYWIVMTPREMWGTPGLPHFHLLCSAPLLQIYLLYYQRHWIFWPGLRPGTTCSLLHPAVGQINLIYKYAFRSHSKCVSENQWLGSVAAFSASTSS